MGSMSTQTMTEFLEARIAEDERAARALSATLTDDLPIPAALLGGIVNPSKSLAECAAKRAIIMSYRSCIEADAHTNITTEFGVKLTVSGMVKGLELAVKHLAAVYADHPAYRQEWAL